MDKAIKWVNSKFLLGFFLSLGVVALGQPARLGWLGAIASILGFTLFFCTLPAKLPKQTRFTLGAVWFAIVQLVQLSWMVSIEFQGYFIIVVYFLYALGLACQFGLLTLLVPEEGKIPAFKLVFCAALWTLMEWMRLFFLDSWNPVGLALTHFTAPLQMTSIFGIFGMSFWVMLTNLIGVNLFRMQYKVSQMLLWGAMACLPYFFGVLHLFYHVERSRAEQNKLDIALVQTSLLPSEKIPHQDRMEDFVSPLVQWSRIITSLKERNVQKWDLIVLPEAAVPLLSDAAFYQYEVVREMFISELGHDVIQKFPPLIYPYAEQRNFLDRKIWCVSNLFLCQVLANHYQSEIVAGLDHSDKKAGKNFNSAFYLQPFSIFCERYDKQVLLPLAEYLPFTFLKPLAKSYGIHDFFSRGTGSKVFSQKFPFSVAICYEETFPEIMREARERGAKFFINISNDNYYPGTSLHEQHFYHARVRAVENGVPLVRACNSGVTAAVNSFGETLKRLEAKAPTLKALEGTLGCRLTLYQYFTCFSFWGEAGIVSLCLLFILSYWRIHPFQFKGLQRG